MSRSRNILTKKGNNKPKSCKSRGNAFSLHVILKPTEEKFMLKDVSYSMTVAQLKEDVEFATGIPISIQRLSYLDEGELQDNTDLKTNDFVPEGTVRLKVWHMYQELVEAVTSNDIDWVFRLGVTSSSDYHTPASDYMSKKLRKEWLEDRALIALCLAAHRGHEDLVVSLIEYGADVNKQTATGKTPLHFASAVGNSKIVNTLLQHGADINAEDHSGNTALSVSERFGHQICSRTLFQFQWQQRAKNLKPSKNIPLLAHQYFDSNLPVWKRGTSAQIYVSKILKPGEFEGTSLSAPRSGKHPSLARRELRDATFFLDNSSVSDVTPGQSSPTDSGLLSSADGKKHLTNLKKPLTYQEWLEKQNEMAKQMALEKKRQTIEHIKQNSEEADVSQEENGEFGSEKWLENTDQGETEKSAQDMLLSAHQSALPGDCSLLPVHQDGALRMYLRSLGKSSSGVSYEEWLNEKEMEINRLFLQKNSNISGSV
ncbi:unnamed protein product [Candidula unifasciata]|uniref:Ubiquitin-like domain-containing protein n=1 Tax=Candidula unifasciata TaxID=100452 RepID=A0A8S3ZPK1_9EUPU|nr:unnamed protein product [Candidula unifasciata]